MSLTIWCTALFKSKYGETCHSWLDESSIFSSIPFSTFSSISHPSFLLFPRRLSVMLCCSYFDFVHLLCLFFSFPVFFLHLKSKSGNVILLFFPISFSCYLFLFLFFYFALHFFVFFLYTVYSLSFSFPSSTLLWKVEKSFVCFPFISFYPFLLFPSHRYYFLVFFLFYFALPSPVSLLYSVPVFSFPPSSFISHQRWNGRLFLRFYSSLSLFFLSLFYSFYVSLLFHYQIIYPFFFITFYDFSSNSLPILVLFPSRLFLLFLPFFPSPLVSSFSLWFPSLPLHFSLLIQIGRFKKVSESSSYSIFFFSFTFFLQFCSIAFLSFFFF